MILLLLLLLFQYSTSQSIEWNNHLGYVELDQNLTLFCHYSSGWNYYEKTWFGGDRNQLIHKSGITYRRFKYSVKVVERGFYLTIHNVNKKDLNAKYKCSLGNIETEFKNIIFLFRTTTSTTTTQSTTSTTTSTKILTTLIKKQIIRPTTDKNNLATTLHYQFFCTLILILSNHG